MRDEQLSHSVSPGQKEHVTVLKLVGPLTLSTMFSFQNEFRALKPKVLIVDLSESPYMDKGC